MRTGRELLIASRKFAVEKRWLSWWHLLSTLSILATLIWLSLTDLPIWSRAFASVLSGLVCVRLFIIFHDFQHKAILRKSRLASIILWIYGILTLNPPTVWNRSHSHHHRHNSKSFGINIGSFPIMSKQSYLASSARERWFYWIARHPLTIVFGYLTVFVWGMSLRPLLRNPQRHWDAGVALVTHGTLLGALYAYGGLTAMILGMLLPLSLASLCGAYLFYSQHNFPSAKLRDPSDWTYVTAALESSSYTQMGRLLHWFTGNIGYHHIHHLNAMIPFYRLPEAMEAMVELQKPGRTSLSVSDIRACLRVKLWDPELDCFVDFKCQAQSAA